MNAQAGELARERRLSDDSLDFASFLSALRRRIWLFLGFVTSVLFATALLALLLPSRYASKATILIEQQEIPQDLVRTTISSYADQRLQTIQQRVMTRDNLLRIVRKFDLYPETRDAMPVEALLKKVSGNISLEVVSGQFIDPRRGVPTEATIAFELGFEDASPDKAFKVANELYTLYHEENLRNRNQLVRETSSFLESEAKKLNARVLTLETELAEFKELHVNELPELLNTNWQMLDRTDAELREIGRTRRTLEDQIVVLEAELAQLNPYSGPIASNGQRIMSPADRLAALQTELVQVQTRYSSDHPDLQRLRDDISGLEKEVDQRERNRALQIEIERVRGELAGIRERYSEDHPDVVYLSAQIAALVSKTEEKVDDGAPLDPTNPAYLQTSTRLETARLEVDSLRRKEGQVRRKQRDLESRISRTPEVEKQYRELAREYGNAAQKYQEVKAKQMEAELAEALENERKGEKFTLIDPPRVPEQPISPNRLVIFLVGIVLSIAAGISAVLVANALDGRIYGAKPVVQLLGIQPDVMIPLITTSNDRLGGTIRVGIALAAALVVGVVAVVSVHQFVVPLDTLLASLSARIGF